MIKYNQKLIFLFVFIVACLFAGRALACAPSEISYISDKPNVSNPFMVIDEDTFIKGGYGIISDWKLPYLYHVYRTLNGQGFEEKDIKDFLVFYKNIFGGDAFYNGNEFKKVVEEWRTARKLVTQEYVPISVYKNGKNRWNTYLNCYKDAFRKATDTLKSRINIYNDIEMNEWLNGQDAVFASCGNENEIKDGFGFMGFNSSRYLQASINAQDGQGGLIDRIFKFIWNILVRVGSFFKSIFITDKKINDPVDVSVQPNIQLDDDKDYQQATTYFYKGDLVTAEKLFSVMAADANHFWQSYAALALGRTYIRMVTLDDDLEKLKNAQAQFQSILSDTSMSEVHKGARLLLNYVNFQLDRDQLVNDIDKTLFNPDTDTDEVIQNLRDLTLTRYDNITQIKDLDADFFQWSFVWRRGYYKEDADFTLLKYQESKSLPWLLASVKVISYQGEDYDNEIIQEVIEQAELIKEDSPIFLTIQYYLLKILTNNPNEKAHIIDKVDSLLQKVDVEKFPADVAYLNELKLSTAENIIDALSFSLNNVIVVENLTQNFFKKLSVDKQIPILDKEAQDALQSFVSLEKWVEIIKQEDFLPASMRQFLRVASFVRAVLLEKWDIAQEIAQMISLDDEEIADDLTSFLSATTIDEKKFAVSFFMLKYHSASYKLDKLNEIILGNLPLTDESAYRSDWWPCCSEVKYQNQNNLFRKFFSEEELEQAKTENEELCNIMAVNYLIKNVINYANSNPGEQIIPEALHLAVNSKKDSSCINKESSNLSKEAFQILHNNYSDNPWAKKTPYWY